MFKKKKYEYYISYTYDGIVEDTEISIFNNCVINGEQSYFKEEEKKVKEKKVSNGRVTKRIRLY